MSHTISQAEFKRKESIVGHNGEHAATVICPQCGHTIPFREAHYGSLQSPNKAYADKVETESVWSTREKRMIEIPKVTKRHFYPTLKGWFCTSCSGTLIRVREKQLDGSYVTVQKQGFKSLTPPIEATTERVW